jgi:hypothetical protein
MALPLGSSAEPDYTLGMRLPRFRRRTLMIAIAVVALMLCWSDMTQRASWSNEMRRRAAIYRILAQEHENAASWTEWVDGGPETFPDPEADERRKRAIAKRARYHLDLQRKYEYTADHPWLPVPPDPPELSWP